MKKKKTTIPETPHGVKQHKGVIARRVPLYWRVQAFPKRIAAIVPEGTQQTEVIPYLLKFNLVHPRVFNNFRTEQLY